MTPEQAASLIEYATSPAILFGAAAKKTYHDLSLLCHPDQPANIKALGKARAERVFAKLSSLYSGLNGKVVSSPTRLGDWVVECPLAKGDICDLYRVQSTKLDDSGYVLKIARAASIIEMPIKIIEGD